MATVKIDAIPTVTAATGDKYVIFDASTGDVGAVDVIVPMQGASTSAAGVAGTVPAPAAGGLNRVLRANAAWGETASPSSSTPSQIMEYGFITNPSGSWNQNQLTLGGMTFQWSQAANGGGHLNMIRASGFTQAAVSGAQTVRKFVDSTVTGSESGALNVWSQTSQNVNNSQSITNGSYQSLEFNIYTRGGQTPLGHWNIRCHADGSNGLCIVGTYIGARVS